MDDAGTVHTGSGRIAAGSYRYEPSISSAPLNGPVGTGTPIQESEYFQPGAAPVTIYPPGVTPTSNYVTYAGGINASGAAVGWADPVSHAAFMLQPAGDGQAPSLTVIPGISPGSVAWYALGINASGTIVGMAPPPGSTAGGDPWSVAGLAFVSDGKMTTDLNTLIAPGSGFLLTSATSINDLGQIAGFADDAGDGLRHAYLLTPTATPEPGAWAIALAAAGSLGLRGLIKADRK